MVLAAEPGVRGTSRVRASLLSWRSQRLKRAISSTIAAETLSLSSALAEATWLQMLVRDLLYEDVIHPEWASRLAPFTSVMSSSCELSRVTSSVSVVDAKSVFDTLQRNTAGSRADRRNAVELAVVRDSLSSLGSQIRWVPHGRMLSDVMTKRGLAKGNFAMMDYLRKGTVVLVDEEGHLNERAFNQSLKSRTREASMSFEGRVGEARSEYRE